MTASDRKRLETFEDSKMGDQEYPRFPYLYVRTRDDDGEILTTPDGNAWEIIGAVGAQMKATGISSEIRSEFVKEATSQPSYEAFLAAVARWVDTDEDQ